MDGTTIDDLKAMIRRNPDWLRRRAHRLMLLAMVRRMRMARRADSVQADVRCDHSSPLCTDCNHRRPHTIYTLETTPRSRPPCDQAATCARTGMVVRCTPNASGEGRKPASERTA